MSVVEVALGERSYQVRIEEGLLDRAGDALRPYARGGRIVAVTDSNVRAAQGERLAPCGVDIDWATVPPGEASKSWRQFEALVDRLLELGVERGDHILAFGGGMVGDLVGFAAAILKRGIGYVQAPTSLLAQVDSSVGGKTAINTAAGKNLVGAFHQPSAVLIDPSTLDTLPERELRAGYAEVVKYGLIGDAGFYAWCEQNASPLLAGDRDARRHAIETCVRAKAAIVADDERETSGRRALLNFGHTFGHAIEAETGMLHGEAVAIGMAMAFRLSVERGLCAAEEAERVVAHLDSVGLPTTTDVAPDRLAALMKQDKKGGALVLTRGIGKAFLERNALDTA